jgi:hypothetical protein
MTRDDIIRMAREAGLGWVDAEDKMERFAALVEEHLISQGYRKCAEGQRTTQFCGMVEAAREEERDACAKLADSLGVHPALNVYNGGPDWYKHGKEIAAAIRARGQK